MSSSSNIFYFLSFALLLQTAFGVTEPIFHSCAGENFTANGEYETNLNKLMAYLYQQAPHTGFGLGSIGQIPNKANGLALCRGDVSTEDCKTCVAEASSYIRKITCPNGKRAMIWYDTCGLKYSNEDFFGQIDNKTKVYRGSGETVSNPEEFNKKIKELSNRLANEASVTPKMYAAGELVLEDKSKKLYGLVQCTRDLSHSDCKKCLDDIIGDLPGGRQGGRAMSGSCIIKYDTNPSLNV